MKKLFFGFALSLFLAFGTQAQTTANKEYKTALVEMFKASGTDQAYISAISQMIDMFKDNYKDVPASFWNDVEKEMKETSISELAELLTPVYQKHLTITDLKELTAFYGTPLGKKYANSMAPITQESMKVGEEWGRKVGEKIAKKLSEK